MQLVFVLFGMSVLIFVIIRMVPGDPALILAGSNASPATLAAIRHEWGLDQPIYIQYLVWVGNILHGNLGSSITSSQPVSAIVFPALTNTLSLASLGVALMIVIGVGFGIISGVRSGGIVDYATSIGSLFGISLPTFWVGIILILVFSVTLHWLPLGGFKGLESLVLPAITLATSSIPIVTRQTRSGIIESLEQDYARAAKARGVSSIKVILKHALKNALIPVLTVAGIESGYMVAATVVVETVFAYPGIGQLLLSSILSRDYPVIQASVLVIAVIFILINLVTDLLYAYVDPRIKY